MMVSVFARLLAPLLGTVQAQPLVISGTGGNETLSYQGANIATLSVQGVKALLLQPASAAAINKLQLLRDATLASLSTQLAAGGTAAQKSFLADYAASQAQARLISQSALDSLSSLKDNGTSAQLTCAAVLAQLKISPVLVTHVPFGGDNHADTDLKAEVSQHVASTTSLAAMFATLAQFGLADRATFALVNVFGRTNAGSDLSGRQHNDSHSVAILAGAGVAGGVVGGAANVRNDPVATNVDPVTGASVGSGGIDAADTFGALGRTLGAALGLQDGDLASQLGDGQVVQAALAS